MAGVDKYPNSCCGLCFPHACVHVFGCMGLVNVICVYCSHKVSRHTMTAHMETVLSILLENVSEHTNHRVRDGCHRGIIACARAMCVGCGVCAALLLKQLPPKYRTAWRPILARISALTDLVDSFGFGLCSSSYVLIRLNHFYVCVL